MIIWTDWNGDKYTFCSQLCLRMYREYLADPIKKHLLPVILPTFGCWWCGTNLAKEVGWCDEAGIVRLEEGHDEDPLEPA